MVTSEWAWAYFISFVVVVDFIIVNLVFSFIIATFQLEWEREESTDAAETKARIIRHVAATEVRAVAGGSCEGCCVATWL